MTRLELALDLDYDIAEPACDFIFNIHAALTPRQQVLNESLTLSQNLGPLVETDPATLNRYLRIHAFAEPLRVSYRATVDLLHHFAPPGQIAEVPIARLPWHVPNYIYPSRYCRSDRLHRMAMREFGQPRRRRRRVRDDLPHGEPECASDRHRGRGRRGWSHRDAVPLLGSDLHRRLRAT